MCGIAGHFGFTVPEPARDRCMQELARRGPDGSGHVGWDAEGRRSNGDAPFALLHTRLAIRDLRAVAGQPMANDAGDVWISYNGEVFGWERDARDLAARGSPLRTTNDTEFVLRGYQRWGLDGLLPRLRGMYAFAIVDWRARRLALVRDRLGVKSAVWYHDGARFAFASTVRALLALLPASARPLSPEGIDAYLAHRYVPSPGTCFRNVRRLQPAEIVEFDLATGRLTSRSYWSPAEPHGRRASVDHRTEGSRDAQAGRRASPDAPHDAPAFPAVVDEAIAQQTVSDRPVGIFLSGGVDSTVVACSLARQGHTELVALTARYQGSADDESAAAAALARRLGMPHVAVEIPVATADVLDPLVEDLDEPFADPACLPLWLLAREASRQVKVVLGGDGGDELFAGYKRYRAHLRTAWRRGFQLPDLSAASAPQPRWSRLAEELSLDWTDAYALRFSGFSRGERRALQPGRTVLPTHWRRVPGSAHAPDSTWAHATGGPSRSRSEALRSLIAIDLGNYLPDYALRKSDLCTMAHGLEQRVPLLDHRVVEAVVALPDAVRFTEPRKLALRALCPQIDGAAYDPFRAPKRGFNPPLGRWLGGDLAPRLESLGRALESATDGQVDARTAQAFVDGYRRGAHRREEQVMQLLLLAESLASIRRLAN